MAFNKITGFLSLVALGGCIATTFPYMRAETAQRIAAPAWMIKRDISAQPFALRAYERIHDRGGVANIYIEGDGAEYTSPEEWEGNPTPKNPIALHLASKDNAQNVIYIARPCQYTEMLSSTETCDKKYWKDSRYSSEVIGAYTNALDEIATRYDIGAFHLIGYSGGAAIATLLSAERGDILSLRTVSGILDPAAQRNLLNLSELTNSLNPTDEALNLTKIPQYHFIGGQDAIVPPAVTHSYLQSIPPTNCVQTMVVQEAGYEDGWVNKWPELLSLPVKCYGEKPAMMFEEVTPPAPMPLFTTREKPAKP
ncbi:MAG: alpha/beta fold hydrolase [Alphaproteobacteria bacterium]